MDNYGSNYAYGSSPSYKDAGQAGVIQISKVEENKQLTPKTFPVLDVVPASYKLGVTGLQFIPKRYLWDFGDGTSSNKVNTEHTYNSLGHHDVMLSVMDNYNTWHRIEEAQPHKIVLGKLDFEGTPRRGDKPLEVTFEDVSFSPTGCFFTGLQWDFGDTYGATGPNPAPHNYLDYGSYTVGINALLDTSI